MDALTLGTVRADQIGDRDGLRNFGRLSPFHEMGYNTGIILFKTHELSSEFDLDTTVLHMSAEDRLVTRLPDEDWVPLVYDIRSIMLDTG